MRQPLRMAGPPLLCWQFPAYLPTMVHIRWCPRAHVGLPRSRQSGTSSRQPDAVLLPRSRYTAEQPSPHSLMQGQPLDDHSQIIMGIAMRKQRFVAELNGIGLRGPQCGVEAYEQHSSDDTMRYVAGVGTSVRVGTSSKARKALHMYQKTVLTTVQCSRLHLGSR
jgi:hypothetical protein